MGLSARPAETALTERALELLRRGPAASVPLIEYVCQMPGAPAVVAEQMALALFAERPEFARDAEGRWTLADRRAPSPAVVPLSFAVIDLETTGLDAHGRDRVTEIAIVVVRDGELTERFETLVHPGRPIPSFITRLTGISNEMVAAAPPFGDVASRVLEMLDGRVFVAHNVDFDWGFLHAELRRTGRQIAGPRLCTVRLARRFLPHLPSRRLDDLAFHYGIDNEARHRAMGDALATARILLRLLAEAGAAQCRTWPELTALVGEGAAGAGRRRFYR